MNERIERFSVGDAAGLEVRIGSGSVRLVGGAAGVVEVSAGGSQAQDLLIEQHGNTVVVEQTGGRRFSRTVRIVATVPEGIDVDVKVGSADVTVEVPVGELRVATGAGDVRAGDMAGSATIATAAGDIALGSVRGRLQASLASGDLTVEAVTGDVDVKSAAGDVRAGRTGGRVAARTAAGDLEILRFDGPDLTLQSMSGDIRLGIPPGRTLEVDIQTLAGSVRNEFGVAEPVDGPGETATLRIKTLSGDVVLRSASG